MASVTHQNVCKYVDSYIEDENKLCIVMEYCDRGDLSQYMNRMRCMGKAGDLGEQRAWRFFIQACLALEAVHEQGIVHGDIKPANLLITGRDLVLKLADFGISQKLTHGYNRVHGNAGTLAYSSPEVLNGEAFNQKADIWSLGCILYEMVCGKRAFDVANNEQELKQRILFGHTPQLPAHFGANLINIYKLCMTRNEEDRPTAKELLSLDFILDISRRFNVSVGQRRQ